MLILKLLLSKGASSAVSHGRLERFGYLPRTIGPADILIHCVSVGEVAAMVGLIKRIQQQYPLLNIAVTTTSMTGSSRVISEFGDTVQHFYLPIDLSWCMRLMLRRIKPSLVLIAEVEVWPNMVHRCWRKDIPIVIVNGRMTKNSTKNYQKIATLFRPTLQKISHICVQGSTDFDNYLRLGAYKSQLTLTNNLKFDINLTNVDTDKLDIFEQSNNQWLVAGSTHEAEEKVLIEAFTHLSPMFPELRLLIVPRHPQRFDKVRQLCQASGFKTQSVSTSNLIDKDTQIVLIDKMGWLTALYSKASVVFIGGSIANKGGHNALEAAYFGKPILMGPYQYNNASSTQQLLESKALVTVLHSDNIKTQAQFWLSHPYEASSSGRAGRHIIEANAGAIDATIALLDKMYLSKIAS